MCKGSWAGGWGGARECEEERVRKGVVRVGLKVTGGEGTEEGEADEEDAEEEGEENEEVEEGEAKHDPVPAPATELYFRESPAPITGCQLVVLSDYCDA